MASIASSAMRPKSRRRFGGHRARFGARLNQAEGVAEAGLEARGFDAVGAAGAVRTRLLQAR